MVELWIKLQFGEGIILIQEPGGALFQRSLGLICPTGSSALLSRGPSPALGLGSLFGLIVTHSLILVCCSLHHTKIIPKTQIFLWIGAELCWKMCSQTARTGLSLKSNPRTRALHTGWSLPVPMALLSCWHCFCSLSKAGESTNANGLTDMFSWRKRVTICSKVCWPTPAVSLS